MALIKTPEEIKILKKGGKILGAIRDELANLVEPGMSTLELENMAKKLFKNSGGQPSFLGYEGFPATTCISVNDEVVHGIPRKDKIMHDGDIVGIDVGLEYQGLYTDTAVTVAVGTIDKKISELLAVTKKALAIGIDKVKSGGHIGDIGQAIQAYVEKKGYSVVRSLVGHGVGHAVHEPPRIPNFGESGTGEKIQAGMVLALEPMVNIGEYGVTTKDDNWTIVTEDGKYSAHFEHTIVVTKNGAEIITK